jgi:hypothetical protein
MAGYGTSSAFSAATGPLSSGTDQGLAYGAGDTPSTQTVSGIQLCLAGDLGNVVPFGLIRLGADGGASASGPVSVEVVRENGRWFVSPVTTVLRALDATIDQLDERTVYSLLGLAYQLPPDGNITLGQPFTPPRDRGFFNSSVFAFDGTQGQEVVGEIDGTNAFASGEIYTAAGKDVDFVEFSTTKNGYAYALTLPETGSYRLILNGISRNGAKLTLWDAKNAPKGLIASDGGSGESCTVNGAVTSCSSSGSAQPLTSSDAGNGGLGATCEIKNNQFVCAGEAATPICPKNDKVAADGSCIPLDIAKSITSAGAGRSSGSAGSGSSRSVTATTSVGPSPTVGVATSVP